MISSSTAHISFSVTLHFEYDLLACAYLASRITHFIHHVAVEVEQGDSCTRVSESDWIKTRKSPHFARTNHSIDSEFSPNSVHNPPAIHVHARLFEVGDGHPFLPFVAAERIRHDGVDYDSYAAHRFTTTCAPCTACTGWHATGTATTGRCYRGYRYRHRHRHGCRRAGSIRRVRVP